MKNSSDYSHQRCQRNWSAANIQNFTFLPKMVQDFLYYRHCRHFSMILDVPDKCGGPEDIFLLLVIKSSPVNQLRREMLRKTWANERLYKGKWIRRVFILGTMTGFSERQRVNKLLEIEQRKYNDILQWDFNDTFFNLTLKQILFLQWMERSCGKARFLLNGDDDVFANTENMVKYLQGLEDNDGSKHLFTGHLFTDGKPERWTGSKYFIPHSVYNSDSYPPYCGGGGFLLSAYTALVIYNMSESITIITIDDAYMGMCLAKANLAPGSHMGVMTHGWYNPSKTGYQYDPCYFKDLLLVHQFSPASLHFLWEEMHKTNLTCSAA
ncbi:N-acetyllactosaminide beta-1,3-N-acetylglucosaminyltransferase 3-like [Tautogolabrus adspersus]